MAFAIHLDVFDPPIAKREGKPYQVAWSVNDSTQEQFKSGVMLLEVLLERLKKAYAERFNELDDSKEE